MWNYPSTVLKSEPLQGTEDAQNAVAISPELPKVSHPLNAAEVMFDLFFMWNLLLADRICFALVSNDIPFKFKIFFNLIPHLKNLCVPST